MSDTRIANYVLFSDDIAGAKLQWLKGELKAQQVDFHMKGLGLKGKPLLEVEYKDYMTAVAILNQKIGSLSVGDMDLAWRDLPDDHEIFVEIVVAGIPVAIIPGGNVTLPGFGEVYMHDAESSNVSAVGWGQSTSNGRNWVVIRYKGGTYYTYFPIDPAALEELQNELANKSKGDPNASVGRVVNAVIKRPADDGTIECRKLDGERWVPVLPKSKR